MDYYIASTLTLILVVLSILLAGIIDIDKNENEDDE